MKLDLLSSYPHRRYNPLKNEWILVSPQRTNRPWQGKQEDVQKEKIPIHDFQCYLCPESIRTNGEKNPLYTSTFVFQNDFPAMKSDDIGTQQKNPSILLNAKSVKGECRVVCFSPRHDLTLTNMQVDEIQRVINTWADQVNDLKKEFDWIQIFENKGEIMGCSNLHPHGQIWASNFVPNDIHKEDVQQEKYFKQHNSVLLMDYLNEEIKKDERVVAENDTWVVIVPFWAIWPFETLLLPKKHIVSLINLSSEDQKDLAKIMKKILQAYDKLFNTSMPYSMGWHFAPFNKSGNTHWQLHAHYYPPLLRSATVKKFMVGYEMLAEPQRDITPEQAAKRLRELI